MKIISDKPEDQGEVVVKKLGNPKKSTVLDGSRSIHIDDEDVSYLNSGSGSSRPAGSRESTREVARESRTQIGDAGVSANGKIDFDKNPSAVDYILQTHESYGNTDDEAGYLATGEKCYRQFNKLFSTKNKACTMTASDISEGLKTHYKSDGAPKIKSASPVSKTETLSKPRQEKTVTFFKMQESKPVKIVSGEKVILSGEKFEICKILNCKNICIMQRSSGVVEQNGVFLAACGNSDGEKILDGCPQEKPMDGKDQMLFEILKAQCGDETQAKKFLFITKHVK